MNETTRVSIYQQSISVELPSLFHFYKKIRMKNYTIFNCYNENKLERERE